MELKNGERCYAFVELELSSKQRKLSYPVVLNSLRPITTRLNTQLTNRSFDVPLPQLFAVEIFRLSIC